MFTSGGQCEEGVKMIIVIGDVDLPTPSSAGTQLKGTHQKGTGMSVIILLILLHAHNGTST